MYLLDLDFTFKDLTGEELKEQGTAAQLIARVLSGRTEGMEPIKANDIARRLWTDGKITIDRADLDQLAEIVKKADLANIAKAPIQLAIKDVLCVPTPVGPIGSSDCNQRAGSYIG